MAVNLINDQEFSNETEDKTIETLEENEDSLSSLLLKYSEENNNDRDTKNNNNNGDEVDDETSGLSSLLSKFSLKKLRSQKWAKPVARFYISLS